jgi:alpha/beta superfamily hydrolase
MPETPLTIDVGPHRLEARHGPGVGAHAAVICHPHPRYGGTLDNNVVRAARDALAAAGFGTLRFNFRGVGASTGQFADGIGEARDLEAVFAALGKQEPKTALHLAAYSFGAWVALRAVTDGIVAPASLLLFSPPVDFMPFDGLRLPRCPCLVVVGDRDDFCARRSLDAWLAGQDTAELTRVVLPGGDHFYGGQEPALRRAITAFVAA